MKKRQSYVEFFSKNVSVETEILKDISMELENITIATDKIIVAIDRYNSKKVTSISDKTMINHLVYSNSEICFKKADLLRLQSFYLKLTLLYKQALKSPSHNLEKIMQAFNEFLKTTGNSKFKSAIDDSKIRHVFKMASYSDENLSNALFYLR